MGKIYVVATPIGNLEDITLRAIETLKKVDIVYAEDTRVTRRLLSHLGIKKPIERLDDNISESRVERLVKIVQEGKSAAVVSDAGTPNISDPGWRIIRTATLKGVEVIPIPGPSALAAIASISHFPLSQFVFLGFPPHKKGRKKFFESVAAEARAIILYESTHRIMRTLKELADQIPEREIIVAKELTKVYERVWRGTAEEVYKEVEGLSDKERKGEFVIAIS